MIAYTKMAIGGIGMNEFEKNIQSKRNDAIDSGIGFIWSFGFFAVLFIIGTTIKIVAG